MGFLLGVVGTIGFIAVNDALKNIMVKVHQHDPNELAKLKIPGYAMYSYYQYKQTLKDQAEKDQAEKDNNEE